jgi:hypothetical protein
VTAGITKVKASDEMQILVRINQAIWNKGSNITMIADLQAHNHRLSVNPILTKHYEMINGKFDTRFFWTNDKTRIPLIILRGDLMMFKFEEPISDKELLSLNLFDITTDRKWKSSDHQQDDLEAIVMTGTVIYQGCLVQHSRNVSTGRDTNKQNLQSCKRTLQH